MKRRAPLFAFVVALGALAVMSAPAQAGLFGKPAASPSPSVAPSALPTASPEPPDVAIPRLQAKLKADPHDQQSMIDLSGQYLSIGRPDLAVAVTQQLLRSGVKTAQVYYLDGYALNQLGRPADAVSDLEQAETLDPSNLGVLAQLADLYIRANRSADAEKIGQRAVALNKTSAEAYAILGGVYGAEQKYDAARTQFQQGLAIDPKSTDIQFQIAQTYAAQNNTAQAIATIDQVLAEDPKNVQALLFKADVYAGQHDDVNAPKAFDDAVVAADSDEQKASILVRKASYYAGEKNYAQAQQILTGAIASYPKEASLHDAYAQYWATQKNVGNAQREFAAALAIDPANTDALAGLAQIAMAQQHYSDAVGYLKRLTSQGPDASAYAMLGQAYAYTHDYANAKEACGRSFQIQRAPQTLGCVASADYQLHNYKEAAQIFDILDANVHGFLDQNPVLLYVAGKSYAQTKQKQKALTVYKRLLVQLPKNSKAYSELQSQIAALNKTH